MRRYAQVCIGEASTWIDELPESLRFEFSREELEEMQEQFREFDNDGGGSVAADELVALMTSMEIETTLQQVQALIDRVDENRSGELEFVEFVRLVSDFRRGHGDQLAAFVQYSKLALTIRREMQHLQDAPTKYCTIQAIKGSAWQWRVLVHGPIDGPYAGGVFQVDLLFGHEYPYQPPSLTWRTPIYHPNVVPLPNGTMTIPGLLDAWQSEWRARGLLERIDRLMDTPDLDLLHAFVDATELADSNASTTQRMRHPRDLAMDCIACFVSAPDDFARRARYLTQCQAAMPSPTPSPSPI